MILGYSRSFSEKSSTLDDPLNGDEVMRYARHLVLSEIGGPGQQALKKARVLVVGAGGLGSPVLLYLAAAGVGIIGIADDDKVDISNLQRQIIHLNSTVGRSKVESAKEAISRLNPHIVVNRHPERMVEENIATIIEKYDIVVDGSDNFATRYLLNDECFALAKPLVSAAVRRFEGQLTTIRAFDYDQSGVPLPSYRCLFPNPPTEGRIASCAQIGIVGAITGILGAMQALEVIKLITGAGKCLIGRLWLFDGLDMNSRVIGYRWNPANPLNGNRDGTRSLS